MNWTREQLEYAEKHARTRADKAEAAIQQVRDALSIPQLGNQSQDYKEGWDDCYRTVLCALEALPDAYDAVQPFIDEARR